MFKLTKDHIPAAGKTTTRWFMIEDLPVEGVEIELSHMTRRMFEKLMKSATKMVRNPTTQRKEPKLDDEILYGYYADNVIRGWRGLTVGKLKRLMQLSGVQDVPEDTPVAYDRDQVILIMTHANGFDEVVTALATNPANFMEAGPNATVEDEDDEEEDKTAVGN